MDNRTLNQQLVAVPIAIGTLACFVSAFLFQWLSKEGLGMLAPLSPVMVEPDPGRVSNQLGQSFDRAASSFNHVATGHLELADELSRAGPAGMSVDCREGGCIPTTSARPLPSTAGETKKCAGRTDSVRESVHLCTELGRFPGKMLRHDSCD